MEPQAVPQMMKAVPARVKEAFSETAGRPAKEPFTRQPDGAGAARSR